MSTIILAYPAKKVGYFYVYYLFIIIKNNVYFNKKDMNKAIETTLFKQEDRSYLVPLVLSASDEENRLIATVKEEDSGMTPELKAAQDEKDRLLALLDAPYNREELTHFRRMSFIDKFFNGENKFREVHFEIHQDKINDFIVNCNLVLEHPELAEEILPIEPRYELEERKDNYYNENYLNEITTAKNLFSGLLSSIQWGNEQLIMYVIE